MNYRMMATENEHFNKHPQHAIFASDTFWGGNNYIDTFEMNAHLLTLHLLWSEPTKATKTNTI